METKVKSGGYIPKGRREFVGTKAATVTVQTDSPASNGHSATAGTSTPSPIETQTQVANRLFRQRAEKIADAHVTVRAGENEWESIYRIEVPDLWSEAFDKIVKLRGNLYRKYPEAIISIEFRGRRELDEAENNPNFADL